MFLGQSSGGIQKTGLVLDGCPSCDVSFFSGFLCDFYAHGECARLLLYSYEL